MRFFAIQSVAKGYRQLGLAAVVFALFVAGAPFGVLADVWSFDQRSDPQGIITSQSGTYMMGTALQTVNAPVSSSGYCFAYWTVNGERVAGLFGQSLTRADVVVLTNMTAIAWYLLPSVDSDSDGVADYLEWQHYGSLTNGPSLDFDGDGFTYADELARGYSPVIRDEPEDGGTMLRLSAASTYREENERKRYDIRSDPQGIITTLGGYAVTGTVMNTVSVPMGASSGYYFGYWEVNGVRQAASSGLALSRVTLTLTNDTVAIARFFSSGDSDADGLDDWREWYWFGNLGQNMNSDFDADGFSISNELARGYAVQIKDEPEDGGVMLRVSAAATYREEGERKRYDIRSEPQGVITTLGGYAVTGTVMNTVSVPMGASSGYYFGYWEVNGVRQAASSGLALSRVTLTLTNDVVAIARFFSSGDSDADGLEDWRERYWFGNLSQNMNSDFDGDGFTISNELARGYAVQIRDEPEDGGVMLRLSASGKYRVEAERKYYEIRSDPQGVISSLSGYVVTGTVVTTVSVPMGASSGYYFGYWEVNGVRQAASSGLALSRVSLMLTNDAVAVARFFSSGDSDADGLEDWRERYWFGNLGQNMNSDPDGDGFSISNELARGYAVQIKDEPEDGGLMMRVSPSVKIWLDYYPRSTGILMDGAQRSGFADSGGTPGALNVGGCAAPALGDWDGDGDLDLLVAGAGGLLRVWENTGSQMVPNLAERTGNFAALSWAWSGIATPAVALGDWSGDGRADLAVGGSTGQVVLVASTGHFLSPQISSITCRLDAVASGAIPALADLYKRGRCDLFLLLPDGTINVYTNTGNAQAPFAEATVRTNLLATAVPAATGLAVMDTDEDGDLDVLVSDDSGRIWEYQQSAGAYSLKTTVYAGTYTGFARRLAIAAGDLDGDGDTDVVGGFAEGGLIYLKNPLPKLLVTPSTATVFSGQKVAFTVDKSVAGAVDWSFLSRRSGGALVATNGQYTAGVTGSCVDVIQASAALTGVKGRAYVNVISAEDVARSGKAVVIAGRASSTDPVWPTTQYLANNGYNALRYRGFGRENIRYLSPLPSVDVDGDGQTNDIAGLSTRANIAGVFTNWVGNADRLFVYLVDHGGQDGSGEGFFRLSPAETVSATELNGWLTGLQERWGTEVTLVIDCCNSGSFLPSLAYSGAAKRVVIAACGAEEPTIFVAGGLVSFSEAFFSGLMLGLSAGDAFLSAQSAMASYQSACLDDDGNGAYVQGADGACASGVRVGASFVAGKDLPQIRSVLDNQLLSGGTRATLWADDVVCSYPVARVWCQVVPPGYRPDPANPVIDLPQLELVYNSGTRRYEAQYSGFSEEGTYKVIYYAKDVWGSVSLPRQGYVVQSGYMEKALIVAGGATGDANWTGVERMADFARAVLCQRRLSTEAIRYLSPQVKPGVDGQADRASLMSAVTNWAQGANKLTVYLVGTSGGTGGTFRLNGVESVSASEIDGLLDAFQASGAGATAVLDFDGAGSFLPALAGGNRVCVSSASAGQKASFKNQGVLSFSCFFFDYVFNGLDVWTAFSSARDKIRNASGRKQDALLDSDADGKYVSKKDQVLARQWYLGSAFMTGADAPTIETVTPDTVLDGANSLTLWAAGVADIGGVSNVFCLVTKPGDGGVADASRVELMWSAERERYEAEYTGFSESGTYACTFFALDNEGQLSMPFQTLVEVTGPDAYESDDTPECASVFEVGTVATHNLHSPTDQDWALFYAPSGYVFQVSVTQLGTNSDLKVKVFYAGQPGVAPVPMDGDLPEVDDNGVGDGIAEGVTIDLSGEWPLPAGFYYVRVMTSEDVTLWGAGSEYALEISSGQGAGGGALIVVAFDKLNHTCPPAGARVLWDVTNVLAFGTANSVQVNLSEGVHTVRVATAEGYLPEEDPVFQGQVANASSYWYGNPKQAMAVVGTPRMAVFQFVPVVQPRGAVVDGLTGEPVSGARLTFNARSGLLTGLTYDGFPGGASYKSPWVTGADGAFPTNVWLPTAGWDLTVSRESYTNLVRAPAVALLPAGSVTNLGTLRLSPVDLNANDVSDAWELRYSLTNCTAASDADLDRASDVSEYLAGTDPTNRLSVFQIVELIKSPAAGCALRWPAVGGRSYRVYWSDTPHNWPAGQSAAVGPTNAWRDPAQPRPSVRFYRVGVEGSSSPLTR